MYGNGLWIFPVAFIQRKCFSYRHFAPFAFLVAVIALIIDAEIAVWPLIHFAFLYFSVASVFAILALSCLRGWQKSAVVLMPFLFCSIHVAYGTGTLIGLVRVLRDRWTFRKPEDVTLNMGRKPAEGSSPVASSSDNRGTNPQCNSPNRVAHT
jgi:hypothetical protein